MPAQSCLHSSAFVFAMAGGWVTSSKRQTPRPPVFEQIQLLWLGLLVCSCWAQLKGCVRTLWSPCLKPPQAHISHLCLFLYNQKSKQFSAFHAPGAASSCVELIHGNLISGCRNGDLLPALLTPHMSYLSRYLFICHFWLGCFAICSFSTVI